MKKSTIIIFVLLIAIFYQNAKMSYQIHKGHKQTQEMLLEVTAERNHVDSIYYKHLELKNHENKNKF